MSKPQKFTPIPSDVLIEQINEEHSSDDCQNQSKFSREKEHNEQNMTVSQQDLVAMQTAVKSVQPDLDKKSANKRDTTNSDNELDAIDMDIGAVKNNDTQSAEPYGFYETVSALQCHAGTLVSDKNLISHRLVNPYTAFVVVQSGTAKFSLNNQQHEITAQQNKAQCCLINVASETLFCRHLLQGQAVTKLTIRDIRPWLIRRLPKHKQQWLEQTADYQWQADETTSELLQKVFTRTAHDNATIMPNAAAAVVDVFANEVLLIRLIDKLWQGFCHHFAVVLQDKPQQESNQHSGEYQFDVAEGEVKSQPYNQIAAQQQDGSISVSTQGGGVEQAQLLQQLSAAWQAGCRDVSALGTHLNLSKRGLQRQLKKHIGITPSAWLMQKNMQYARQQLLFNGVSIKEVAYQCGYSQVANFTQAFKQYYHTTPARYVARYQNSLLLS
ncbi:helix-turn-helix domain-containing protein [Psychrobacter sp. I-STPA10]|uniref:helix-turn-helix domain-containing protein n=1 Tax=Psychrobacter sp. I-STPA10 TaxID=2585769 RepID=UPI001E44E122|nr:helix-turn-helix transcriptional regulator [Psychrobacter sp. I-STPA10]